MREGGDISVKPHTVIAYAMTRFYLSVQGQVKNNILSFELDLRQCMKGNYWV